MTVGTVSGPNERDEQFDDVFEVVLGAGSAATKSFELSFAQGGEPVGNHFPHSGA